MLTSMMETIKKLVPVLPRLMMIYAMIKTLCPFRIPNPFTDYIQELVDYFYCRVHITIPEYQNNSYERSKAYAAVERYLHANSTKQAKNLEANAVKGSEKFVLTMSEEEEVLEEYQGIKLQWKAVVRRSYSPKSRGSGDEERFFRLAFDRRDRKIVTERYLKHVLEGGKEIQRKERQRRLYTNNSSFDSFWGRNWTQVPFQHPATFDTLAMDPVKKKEIVDELMAFTRGREYYQKVGKAWKRGYLLYGPPGTGKSTMIAAMANFLNYDIYDLELTSVEDNVELKKLVIDTTSKSIVVIEDIDCSLDVTGKREKNKDVDSDKEKLSRTEEKKSQNKVTLSGLLNFIDGVWSATVGERIVIFTTNHVEKLDPALIRRGRMDNHIEMSYCCFESFKVLAKNYLGLDCHDLFDKVKVMLEGVKMTPADVAENLMPKLGGEDVETCLMRLIDALEEAKQKAEELARDQEKKEKQQKEEEGSRDEDDEKNDDSDSSESSDEEGSSDDDESSEDEDSSDDDDDTSDDDDDDDYYDGSGSDDDDDDESDDSDDDTDDDDDDESDDSDDDSDDDDESDDDAYGDDD